MAAPFRVLTLGMSALFKGAPVTEALSRLLRDYGRQFGPQYALAAVMMVLIAGSTSGSAYIMKDVVDRIFVARDHQAILWIPAVIIAMFLVKGLATWGQEVILGRIGNRIVAAVQARIFDHVLEKDISWFQRTRSSDLTTILTYNANAARDMLNMVALGLCRDLVTVISLIGVMIWNDPVLSLIAVLGAPISVYAIRRLIRSIRTATRREVASMSTIVGIIRETSQGIRIAKSFQMEGHLRQIMSTAITDVERLANRLLNLQARTSPVMDTLAGLTIAAVIFYAGWRSLQYNEPPGSLLAFITALLLASDPCRRLARLNMQLAQATVGVQMMYDLLDSPKPEANRDIGSPLKVSEGEVAFEDVSFGYDQTSSVLQKFSARFPAGSTSALVGLSGSGKTTLFNLLLRFWDPSAGHIRVDGQDTRACSLHSLRESISLVSQDVFLFDGSVADNIRGGFRNAPDDAVVAAAKAAFAHEFISVLPLGYNTPVGELGNRLSGGQRQRISIARAFLKNAPIILLDEPTSALDSEAERAIQTALAALTSNKTAIVIAHRLSTVQAAAVIHVLDGGRLMESGTHTQLIAQGGVYARLYRLQFEVPEAA